MAKTSLAVISSQLNSQLNRLPARARSLRKATIGVQHRALRMTKSNPGRALLGAFAIGFVVSRLAKLVLV